MSATPTWTYQDTPELRGHWWWRPGWGVGTRFYAWHVTFEPASGLHRLVDDYQDSLRGVGGMDLIPHMWRHLTMQGVGHVEDVPESTRDAVVAAVRDKVATLPPLEVTFHRPVIRTEAIVLPPAPLADLDRLRQCVRDGMAHALGPRNVPEHADGYEPHVSIAYANTQQPSTHVRDALNTVDTEPATMTIDRVALIRMHRDQRMYEWTTEAVATLSP